MKFKEIKKKNYAIGSVILIILSVSIFIFKDSSNKGESLTNQIEKETGQKVKAEVKNVDIPKINIDEGSSEAKIKMAEKINKENNITDEDYRNFREGIEKKENEPVKKPNKPTKSNKPNSNIINPEVKPSNDENSSKNNNPEENKNNKDKNEKVYVEGFGWVEPSESQGKEGNSNGDFNKVIGQMD
ncbi:DUF6550 family protein [Clostridioides sp. ZZV15-6597]|uniref:DUF6550 family protein n=1 Tax=Clostridioides sp. ZZV15-6597 TaxID=2811500 RepID=UPI001D0FED3E|nr:hypothetical protein [Clostridioides sp. ZZV15-6597]